MLPARRSSSIPTASWRTGASLTARDLSTTSTWRDYGEAEADRFTKRRLRASPDRAGLSAGTDRSRERQLVEALASRFQKPHAVSRPSNSTRWDDDYAAAMRRVHYAFPDDHDIMALLVEALITRTPRRLWDVKTGLPAQQRRHARSSCALRALDGDDRQGGPARRIRAILHLHIQRWKCRSMPERRCGSADRSGDDGARCRAHEPHAGAHLRAVRRLRESQDRERAGDPRRRHVCRLCRIATISTSRRAATTCI